MTFLFRWFNTILKFCIDINISENKLNERKNNLPNY